MKDLLKSLSTLSEGETKDTKTGRVHKGSYGSEYDTDREGNEVKKAAPDVKKGRGRPKKDGGEDSPKFDTSALSGVFGGGKKPSKSVGTVSKKHSLKEYMEVTEKQKKFESIMEGMFGGDVDHSSVANNLAKLARVIKSVQTPEQFAVAQKYARRMSGTIMKHQHDKMGFGSGMRANIGVSRDIQKDLAAKARELGIEYNALEEAGEQVEIKPASQTQTQVIQQGDKTLGTVSNPQLANQIKQAIGQGQMSLSTDEKGMMEAKKKPDFLDVDKDKNKKESFKKAVADKEARKKVAESISFNEMNAENQETAQEMLAELQDDIETFVNTGHCSDKLEAFLKVHGHAKKKIADESAINDFAIHGVKPTNDFTRTGTSMAAPRGTPTTANRPVPEPTPFGTDPIAATTDRAINFISGLRKPSPFSESKTMKDMQVESWASQLDSLLNEGITVSSSQGQQGAPDSVSVTATETDADALLSVLRNAGIGGFGAEPQAPEIGYGVAQGGEEEFDGTGTEPQPAPGVVGDDGDMLSMLKKMAGIEGGDSAVVAVGGDEEGGQDYEDEEGSEEQSQTLEPAGDEEGSEEQDSGEEESEEEEVTDEGNAFGQEVRQKKSDNIPDSQQTIKTGGQNLPVKEEATCESCGQAQCGCEHVEESFANTSGHGTEEQELAKLKALLSMGNDMHRMKQSQAMGNPVRVAESDALAQWKKLSGI